MGYQSLQRGMSRLARWERGEEGVWGDRVPKLAQALGVGADELASFGTRELDARARAERTREQRSQGDERARRAEADLLARCGRELIQLAAHKGPDAIPDVALRSAGASFMIVGGGRFRLRALLQGWNGGLLTLPCDCCGGPFRLTWVAGSPFSGRHQVVGFCESEGISRAVTLPKSIYLVSLVPGALDILRVSREASETEDAAHPGLSLTAALAMLGMEVPPVTIRDAHGDPLAAYDPSSGEITVIASSGAALQAEAQSTSLGVSGLSVRTVVPRGPAREHGSIVIGSLEPLELGVVREPFTELVDARGQVWRLYPGHLENDAAETVAWFDAPVPAMVAGWIAEWTSKR